MRAEGYEEELMCTLPGVTVRRSRRSDAAGLAALMRARGIAEAGIPRAEMFDLSTESDFLVLIQTSFLSLTAVSTTEPTVLLGCLALSDRPRHVGLPATQWESLLQLGVFASPHKVDLTKINAYNTLWLRMLLAPPSLTHAEMIANNNGSSSSTTGNGSGCGGGGDGEAAKPSSLFAMELQAHKVSYTDHLLASELLRIALGLFPAAEHLLCPRPPGADFATIAALSTPLTRHANAVKTPTFSFDGELLHVPRERVIAKLQLRHGRIEDYDDFVPLLVCGFGVVTPLPKEFYLEEILKDQDALNKVVVAEDVRTHQVVGLAYLRGLSNEAQQRLKHEYATGRVDKLRALDMDPDVRKAKALLTTTTTATTAGNEADDINNININNNTSATAETHLSNTFRIEFLYFNPDYNASAADFVPYMFAQFPMCEYAAIALPHTTPETPVLRHFQYVPLRRYEPYSAKTELVSAPPPGLWVGCRYSLDELHVEAVRTRTAREHLETWLTESARVVPNETAQRVAEDLLLCFEGEQIETRKPHLPLPAMAVFALRWRREGLIGVAAARQLTVKDMYALRANYDLDAYVDYYARTGRSYGATDIMLSPQAEREKYYTSEMPAIIIRTMYVRPAFRPAVTFFVREMLRLYEAEMAVVLAVQGDEPCAALLADLVPAQPRRVVERPGAESEGLMSVTDVDGGRREGQKLGSITSLASRSAALRASSVSHMSSRQVHSTDGDDDNDEGAGRPLEEEEDEHNHEDEDNNSGSHNKSVTRQERASLSRSTLSHTRRHASRHQVAYRRPEELGALYFTTCRCLGDHKTKLYTRLVIVGAGATGLACLYRLLMVPYVHLGNLLLVSTDGMPPHANQADQQWLADKMELLEREQLYLSFGGPVRVVTGTLVDIDKANRFVALDNGTFELYDHLLLTTGRQYVLPTPIATLLQQESHASKNSIIPIASELATDQLRHRLAEMEQNVNSVANVMVYGSGLDAFAAVTAMVQLGFSAQRIVVCSRQETMADIEPECYQAAVALLKAMGISVLRGYEVTRMEYDEEENCLTTVMLSPLAAESRAGESVELACSLIVAMEDKDIDGEVLTTLNKRSIVFDGRVIVENNYRTTDPHIFAAGPVSMFTRRYGATQNFDDFNARDVGAHVATVLLGFLGFDEFVDARFHDTGKSDPTTSQAQAQQAMDSYMKVLEENGSASAAARARQRRLDQGGDDALSETTALETLHKLPRYHTPRARRVRFPHGFHFFSAMCVDFDPTICLRLDCTTLEANHLLSSMHLNVAMPSEAGSAVETELRAGESIMNKSLSRSSSHHQQQQQQQSAHQRPGQLNSQDNKTLVGRNSRSSNGSRHQNNGAEREQNLLAIYVNTRSGMIDAVMYFGNGKPEVYNYYALIGYPETVLNLVFRYREAERAAAAASKTEEEKNGVTCPPATGLTAGIVNGKLDLMAYLRLPHMQVVLHDGFRVFFDKLRQKMRAHDEAMAMRRRILTEHRMDCYLGEDERAAYQAELLRATSAFQYEVQLELLRFLHEHKDFLPQNMYLPNIQTHTQGATRTRASLP